MSNNFEIQALEEDDFGQPERVLYGQVGYDPNVDRDCRDGLLIEIDEQNPSQKSRINARVSEITFSDAYEVMEECIFETEATDKAISGRMYHASFDPEELAQDIHEQIQKYGLEGGASPPEGYEITVSNPE